MSELKLIPVSKLLPKEDITDSLQNDKVGGNSLAWDTLLQAQHCWDSLRKFRLNRERAKRYCYGDQWKDVIEVDGKRMTEEAYIEEQGNVPLKNNLIRRLVRNVLGVYRSQSKEPTCSARDRDEQSAAQTMSTVLQANWQINKMTEVNARSFEEFLISALVVHKKTFGWRNGRYDCWTDIVNPNRFFIDTVMQDVRGWDVSMIGEIHDVPFQELCAQFASSKEEYEKLRDIYKFTTNKEYLSAQYQEFGQNRLSDYSFFIPKQTGLCRVIEVWNKESKARILCHDLAKGEYYKIEVDDYATLVEAENEKRIAVGLQQGMNAEEIPIIQTQWTVDTYWYYRYITPTGIIIKEGETPYDHKSHPYVFKAYPFLDGELHSFVEDVIDQQRYVNRLITLNDWIVRASAKGVLLVPEDCISDEMSLEEIADEWTRFNGVIAIKTKPGVPLPQQIANNSTHIGIHELLNMQLKFFEDISGVNGALQGKPGVSGTSGSLYAQQTQNATVSLLDVLESFSSFVVESAYKDVKNIQQAYTKPRIINIAGVKGTTITYDPQQIIDLEFDLSISESTSTPAYRQLANDFLMQLWSAGQISLEHLLETGDFPFADDLLQKIRAQQEEMQKQAQQAHNTLQQ